MKTKTLMGILLLPALLQAVTVNIDGSRKGRIYEGIGGVSAGASSRLLFDYPDSIRSIVLDYLFKPNFGAVFQHLKVEIGGGENSTCGSEPSHAITRAELTSPVGTRGYELWLAKQARDRNPEVILDGLSWCYPYWFSTTWSQDQADYIVAFLDVAKNTWGLTWDCIGACKNEKGYNRNWIVNVLRPTLNQKGYSTVKLHAAESIASDWGIANAVTSDASLSAALDAISIHYASRAESRTPPANARAWGKPLWDNEEWSRSGKTWDNSILLARNINMGYARDLFTKQSIWCPIDCIYGPASGSESKELPIAYASTGAMRADMPWCGHYEIYPALWAVAHTTQFAQLGWSYLTSGCGRPSTSTWDGSYVTLKDPTTGDYSIIIVTGSATSYTFNLSGSLSTGVVHVWRTNSSSSFEKQTDITPSGNSFSISCQANSIYSLTTTTGQSKGTAVNPPAAAFPFPYRDNYESYSAGATPRYHADQKGTFEVVADASGKYLRQIVPQQGILWGSNHSTDKPCTVFGDPAWTDYDIIADVYIDGGDVEICSRVGHVLTNRGYRLVLAKTGAWQVCIDATRLKSGTVGSFNAASWHNLKLRCSSNTITAYIDGVQVTSLSNQTRLRGMASFASTYNANMFDNLVVGPIGVTETQFNRQALTGTNQSLKRSSPQKTLFFSSSMNSRQSGPVLQKHEKLYSITGKKVTIQSATPSADKRQYGTGLYIHAPERNLKEQKLVP